MPDIPRALDEDLYQQLIDTGPDALIVVDEGGLITLVNRQAERLFGYARADLVGQPVELLIPARFRAAHAGHRHGFVTSPKVRPMGSGLDLYGLRKDGSEFPIEISLSPLRTARGMLASANIRDVSERKEREREIRRIQEHLLSAVESIQGAFAIFDAADRLVLCNSAYRQMAAATVRGELVGRTFEDILDESLQADGIDVEDTPRDRYRERRVAFHRAPAGALDTRTTDGRHLRVFERRTLDGGTVTMISDVSDDMAKQDELRRARANAEAANAAKSEFLASMSHELRTPLNAILGFAQLLQHDKKAPLSDRHRERVDHVVKGGDHLLRLIDDVLDLARIEAGRVLISPEPVSVADVLLDVGTTLQPMAARAEVNLTVEPPASLPLVVADRTRFRQILTNFGSNAIKYGRRGGHARIAAALVDGRVRVTVSDDGMGIPADKQDKIFQPFQRAGQETGSIEGTGIGLSISKRLAELMQGAVGFASSAGQGSAFWVELPVMATTAVAEHEPARTKGVPAAITGQTETRHLVVYVEDNPSSIALMEALLADFDDVELMTAPTAEIGIELVRARQPRVVIMDINLPGMSGFEATQRLREWPETAHIPVIALSAAAMVQDAARVSQVGFHRYLTKPVKVDELVEVLAVLLAPAAGQANR